MSVIRDYRMNVIPMEDAAELFWYSNKDSFRKICDRYDIEYDHGRGRRKSMFSINALNKLSKDISKEICIPDEFYEKCIKDEVDVVEEVKPMEKPSDDWMAKAEKLGWLLDMDSEDVIDLALNRLRDDVVKGFLR